jgi:hypothetical protein
MAYIPPIKRNPFKTSGIAPAIDGDVKRIPSTLINLPTIRILDGIFSITVIESFVSLELPYEETIVYDFEAKTLYLPDPLSITLKLRYRYATSNTQEPPHIPFFLKRPRKENFWLILIKWNLYLPPGSKTFPLHQRKRRCRQTGSLEISASSTTPYQRTSSSHEAPEESPAQISA